MNRYHLSEINIYPIKSLGGISLQSSLVEERGLQYDRRWMLVDESSKFITQRSHPQMALLKVEINNDTLIIKHKQNKIPQLTIPLLPFDKEKIKVQIWNDIVSAIKYSREINDWFAGAISFNCSLVYMPDSTKRKVDQNYTKNKTVGFADGYPFLIIGENSLNDLNSKMKKQLPMNRFRPNFVFRGGKSYDEDNWKKIRINEIDFLVVKPCARCTITTVAQETGNKGKEPLNTLSKFRKTKGKVLFGQNMVAEGMGKIKVGDQIIIT